MNNIKDELNVNEILSIEQTKLANERTLLSYYRTSLAMIAGGTSLIQFFENKLFVTVGYFLLPLGLLFIILGLKSYKKTRKKLKEIIK